MIKDIVIPNSKLQGLYQVSSEPISKYDLLKIVAKVYGKTIEIVPDHEFQCDRSLNSSLFKAKTGYQPPAWPEMIEKMHQNYLTSDFYTKR
jgi:dTDP-4-dehydrorhamnose reductase